jgi:hypothetical protein
MSIATVREPLGSPEIHPPMIPAQIAEALGLPMTRQGQPAMADHVPKRFISSEEARARGFSMYWDGAACRRGHQAARYVANPRRCSGCDRAKAGLPQIYPTSKAQQFFPEERIARKQPDGTVAAAPATAPASSAAVPALTKKQIAFLATFNDTGSLEAASRGVGMSPAEIETERLTFAPFEAACAARSVPHHVVPPPEFQWTEAKYRLYARTLIDSGLHQVARDAVGCSPSQYFEEYEANAEFREAVGRAETLAARAVKDALLKSGLGGQHQALAKLIELQEVEAERALRKPRRTAEQIKARIDQRIRRLIPTFEESTFRTVRTGALIRGAELERVFRDRRDGSIIGRDELEQVSDSNALDAKGRGR